jgi:hypothetical protein
MRSNAKEPKSLRAWQSFYYVLHALMNVLWYNKAQGGVAEWSNALVLKTRVSQGTVSSNLTPSATYL